MPRTPAVGIGVISVWLLASIAAARSQHADHDKRQARYERRQAKLVESGTPRAAGGDAFRIYLGGKPVSDWDFANELSEMAGTPLNPEMMAVYHPPGERKLWAVITGYSLGGMVSLFSLADYSKGCKDPKACASSPTSVRCNERKDGKASQRLSGLIGTGVGVAILGGTVAYHLLSESGRDTAEPYFSRPEAERLVAEYNRLLRARFGLDSAGGAQDEDAASSGL